MRCKWLPGILVLEVFAETRFLQEVTSTTATATFTTATATQTSSTTTETDPCQLATTACACAAGGICAWLVYANGGGDCRNQGRPVEIDCSLCEQQAKCATFTCPQLIDPCNCAATAGCAWDLGFEECVASAEPTDCQACPTRVGCNLDPPILQMVDPPQGGSHSSGSDLSIVIQFNKQVTWCPSSGSDDASFWCAGSVNDQVIPRTYMQFSSTSLTIDMSWYLNTIALQTERTCGVSIGAGKICDQDNAAFAGMPRGEYSFQLLDEVGPSLMHFDPDSLSVEVPLDGNVNLLWSEPILLNPTQPQAELSRLEVGNSGTYSVVQSFTIPIKVPEVEIISSVLRIYLGGLIQSGQIYTLQLPAGSVMDLAGNLGEGLPAQAFNFRAASATLNLGSSVPSSSNAVGIVVLVVCVAVCCILAGGIGLVKLVRSNRLVFKERTVRTKPMATPMERAPTVAPEPSQSFAAANAAAQTAYRQAAAAAERLREENEAEKSGTWARERSSKPKATPKASAKVHPEREGFNAGRARRSTPNPEGNEAPESKAQAPAESNLSPEVKAVEKKLHDQMNDPIATRKKLLKELLVEYHPDKNSSSHAKEVFQYVNNARSWFLVES